MSKAKDQWLKIATSKLSMDVDTADRLYFLSKRVNYYENIKTNDRILTDAEARLDDRYTEEIRSTLAGIGFTEGYRSSVKWFEFTDPRSAGGFRVGFSGCPGNNLGDTESWDVGGESRVFKLK